MEPARDIGRLLGADRIRAAAGRERAAAELVVEPESVDELAELVRKCESDALALAPLGAARTLSQIRRAPVAFGVSLTRLRRVIAYESDDMTLTLQAGATLAEVARITGERRQRLPADASDPASTTVGALIGAAHAGPLRLSEGTVRDNLIGIEFVGARGRIVRAGGRVVKNVAGYDLMKVMTGSFGTLGIVTEATFKVRPMAEEFAIARAGFADADDAFAAASALIDALPLAHLELLSEAPSARLGHRGRIALLAGLSGNAPEIAHQRAVAGGVLGLGVEFLAGADARDAYERLRDVEFADVQLSARLAVNPRELRAALSACGAEFVAHAGSGVAEIFIERNLSPEAASAETSRWRDLAHRARGNLRILSAAPEIRASIDFFDSPPNGALALMRRLKSAFDPAGIFNPSCFVAGI
jgi:glycolate oxidase FAD binding subunit